MPNPSCPHCAAELDALDARQQWCSSCRRFGYAQGSALNEIIGNIHSNARRHAVASDTMFQIGFEQFTHPGVTFVAWRCYAKRDGRLVKSSVRPHRDPDAALRELAELLAPS